MTRIFMSVAIGLLAASVAVPASATDLPARAPVKAPEYRPYLSPAPVFTWQGFYAGFDAGYGIAESTLTVGGATGSVDPDGAILGSTLGYNFQTGNVVFGIEGGADYSWIEATNGGAAPCAGCTVRNHYLATVRGRLGYAWDRWLAYVTGGAAFGDITISTPAGGSQADNRVGWTAGGGVEYAFAGTPWGAKLEYLYADLGTGTCDAAHCGTPTTADFKAHLIRAGVNYRY